VGRGVVGDTEGVLDGLKLGCEVVGDTEGVLDGLKLGREVVGDTEGALDGLKLGREVVGVVEGEKVGVQRTPKSSFPLTLKHTGTVRLAASSRFTPVQPVFAKTVRNAPSS